MPGCAGSKAGQFPFGSQPLEAFHQPPHQLQTCALLPLTHEHERRRGLRDPRLQIFEQLDADVGVAYAAQRPPHPLQADEQIVADVAALPLIGKGQHFANSSRRDTRVVNTVGPSVEHSWNLSAKNADLRLK